MSLLTNKTKIVCTIGPASDSPKIIEKMIRAGMDVARLNFSHGDFPGHKKIIEILRASARKVGSRLAIMADLPGPKIRIGRFIEEPVELKPGDAFTLTTEEIAGDMDRVSVTFDRLPRAVKHGMKGDLVVLTEGPSSKHPDVNLRMELIDLRR